MTDLRARCQLLLLLAGLCAPWRAAADIIDAVNIVRYGGCAGRVHSTPPLRESGGSTRWRSACRRGATSPLRSRPPAITPLPRSR